MIIYLFQYIALATVVEILKTTLQQFFLVLIKYNIMIVKTVCD